MFPVSVPQECVALAYREGVPTVIENRYQAAKAKLKLYRLSTRDPLVRGCRQAVDRMRTMMQEARIQAEICHALFSDRFLDTCDVAASVMV